MSPSKNPPAKTMEESDEAVEAKMDQIMKLLQRLGNRLDKHEVERSVGSPVPASPIRDERVFGARISEVQGLTISSLEEKTMQQRGNRLVKALSKP
uniref:AlNc14C496G11926 protein n=1 Tax=Albugo laibachii Nc14 TaxID=890382 RepID=F0X0I2_9STRA|nr:AlNc14C496G11926 [Albugo laibachii Nc14]|eukprot:CCA27272.1 AlNc14C496G11926 [Albugo laibachii Nc14]